MCTVQSAQELQIWKSVLSQHLKCRCGSLSGTGEKKRRSKDHWYFMHNKILINMAGFFGIIISKQVYNFLFNLPNFTYDSFLQNESSGMCSPLWCIALHGTHSSTTHCLECAERKIWRKHDHTHTHIFDHVWGVKMSTLFPTLDPSTMINGDSCSPGVVLRFPATSSSILMPA